MAKSTRKSSSRSNSSSSGSSRSRSGSNDTTVDKLAKAAMSKEMLAGGSCRGCCCDQREPESAQGNSRRRTRCSGYGASQAASSDASSATKLGSLIAEAVAEAAQRVMSGKWSAAWVRECLDEFEQLVETGAEIDRETFDRRAQVDRETFDDEAFDPCEIGKRRRQPVIDGAQVFRKALKRKKRWHRCREIVAQQRCFEIAANGAIA